MFFSPNNRILVPALLISALASPAFAVEDRILLASNTDMFLAEEEKIYRKKQDATGIGQAVGVDAAADGSDAAADDSDGSEATDDTDDTAMNATPAKQHMPHRDAR